MKLDLVQSAKEDINDDNRDNIDVVELSCQNPAHTHFLPTRFQYMANISVFLKNNVSQPSFTKSQYKEINGLLEKGAFKVISILDVFNRMRIFNSRFIDEIKNKRTAIVFKKSRLVV